MKKSILKIATLSTAALFLSACDPQKMDASSIGAAAGSGASSSSSVGSFDLVQDDFTDGDINSVRLEVQGDADGTGTFDSPITFSYSREYNFIWNSTASTSSLVKISLFPVSDPTTSAVLTKSSCDVNQCDAESINCYFVGFNGVLESAQAYCYIGEDKDTLGGASMADLATGLGGSLDELPITAGIRFELCDSSGESCDVANLGYVDLKLEE